MCISTKKNQEAPTMDTTCLWDPNSDFCISVAKDNQDYFFILYVYAISNA